MTIEKQAAEELARRLTDVLAQSGLKKSGTAGDVIRKAYAGVQEDPLRSGLLGAGIGAGVGGLGMGLRSYLQGNSSRLALLDAGLGAGMGAGLGGIVGAAPGLLSPKDEAIRDLVEPLASQPDTADLLKIRPGAWITGGLAGGGLGKLWEQRALGSAMQEQFKSELPEVGKAKLSLEDQAKLKLKDNLDLGHGWLGWLRRSITNQPIQEGKWEDRIRRVLGDPLKKKERQELEAAKGKAKPAIEKSTADFEAARKALRDARAGYTSALAKQTPQHQQALKQTQQDLAQRHQSRSALVDTLNKRQQTLDQHAADAQVYSEKLRKAKPGSKEYRELEKKLIAAQHAPNHVLKDMARIRSNIGQLDSEISKLQANLGTRPGAKEYSELKKHQREAAGRRSARGAARSGLATEEEKIRSAVKRLMDIRAASERPVAATRKAVKEKSPTARKAFSRVGLPVAGALLMHLLSGAAEPSLSGLDKE